MKIAFQKITNQPKSFSIQKEAVLFSGEITKLSQNLYKITATLKGEIPCICDRSGEEFFKKIEEELILHISNGIWDMQSQDKNNALDVIEFFDGFINFEYILESEISSIQMQYHTKEGE